MEPLSYQEDLISESQRKKILTQHKYTFAGIPAISETEVTDVISDNPQYEVQEDKVVLKTKSAFDLPVGTTAQRPLTPQIGNLRYNSTLEALETYGTTGWKSYVLSGTTGALMIKL